ncbi:MAG: hypothetical protein AAGC55_16575 [Myxococcota bacterium]
MHGRRYSHLLIIAALALAPALAHAQTASTTPDSARPAAPQLVTVLGPVPASPLSATPPAVALGPLAFWFGRALGATSIDSFIDVAIAVILGLPTPGAGSHVANFLTNLLPYAGEASTARRIRELYKVIDRVAELAHALHKRKIPGAEGLLKQIHRQYHQVQLRLGELDLPGAKQAFFTLLGRLREAQIAAALHKQGVPLVAVGMKKVGRANIGTDIDVVFWHGNQLIFAQVKAGRAANLGHGSRSWNKFDEQLKRTAQAARRYEHLHGIKPQLRYYVDTASTDAAEHLRKQGIPVLRNHTLLTP